MRNALIGGHTQDFSHMQFVFFQPSCVVSSKPASCFPERSIWDKNDRNWFPMRRLAAASSVRWEQQVLIYVWPLHKTRWTEFGGVQLFWAECHLTWPIIADGCNVKSSWLKKGMLLLVIWDMNVIQCIAMMQWDRIKFGCRGIDFLWTLVGWGVFVGVDRFLQLFIQLQHTTCCGLCIVLPKH